ncbi:hypothetical protein SDC9_156507 [bioreactor metagenome]|uniref:Uncharacterized protein n=1 Tax=bioreactor metagenome TaxID=1076179 RepID=A0A645F4D5_9ZZZZ
MGKTQLAVRSGANAQIVAELPVVAVVKTLVAILGIGRDFIALHAGSPGAGRDKVQHLIGRIVLGHQGRVFGEIGVWLDGKVINRQMWRRKRQCRVHIALQIEQALAGQGIHEIDIEGLEIVRRLAHRSLGLRRVVHTAHSLQIAVVKALHPD